MEILNNWVLVLPDKDYDKIGSMELADIFEPGKRVSVFGEVLSLPKTLWYWKEKVQHFEQFKEYEELALLAQDYNRESLEYDTDIELQVGDRVAFRYLAKMNAYTDGLVFDTDRGKAILMPYDLIYMAIRGEQMHPINGWVIVEPIDYTLAEIRAKLGGMVADLQDERKEGIGVVAAVGSPLRGYLKFDYQDVDEVQVGQTIRFRKDLLTPIEWKSHKELGSGKNPYIRVQRKDILLIHG